MSYVPTTPRRNRVRDRDRRLVQSSTPTSRRSGAGRRQLDHISASPRGSYPNKSLLLPRISNSIPPRPVTPSHDNSWEVSKDRPAMSIIDRMPSTPPRRSYSSSRSVVSESAAIPFDEDEMPDDEKSDTVHRLSFAQKRYSGLEQPLLAERFVEKPQHNARVETQQLKKEVHRLTDLLSRAHGQDSRRDNAGDDQRYPVLHNVDAADRGGGAGIHHHLSGQIHDDDVSSLGGIEDSAVSSSSLNRLSLALRSRLDPSELSTEEKGIWDKVQLQLAQTRIENRSRIRKLEKDLRIASEKKQEVQDEKQDLEKKLFVVRREFETTKARLHVQGEAARTQTEKEELRKKLHELEKKHKEVCAQLEEQQVDHERAIRAVQRVLADVTTQRDALAEKLQGEIADLEKQNMDLKKQNKTISSPINAPASANDVATLRSRAQRAFALEREMEDLKSSLSTCETARDELKQDLEQKGGKIVILEQEVNIAKSSLASSREREETLCRAVEKSSAEVEELNKRIETISSRGLDSSNVNAGNAPNQTELDALRKQLQDEQSSLETAKNIIASLETANGSLATDLRAKLKDKEEEITILKNDMASGKRTLDSLATELRDLQLQKKQLGEMKKQANHAGVQQIELRKEVEKSLSELRSATAVHEAGTAGGVVDDGIVNQVSTVLGSLLSSLDASISGTRALATSSFEEDARTTNDGDISENFENVLQDLPDDARARLSALEDALRTKTIEIEEVTKETSEERLAWEEEEAKMKAEIRSLQDQCMTNMQVLTKKERELEVLRDSLEVSDGVGYISDDGTDAEDEEDDVGALTINRTMSIDSSHYSYSQAEAVATLLVQGGTGIEVTSGLSSGNFGNLQRELKKANTDKEKATKDLKHEQEALANAKMIISSLERANKTMLEDLRSRLLDSNTAIASLLEKSTEQEKKSSSLQSELDQLKEEKEKESESHKSENQKLKDEQVLSSLKLAAKEREIENLMQRLRKYEENSPEFLCTEGESTEETKIEESPRNN